MCLDFFMIWRVAVLVGGYVIIAIEYAHLPITGWQILLIKTYLCTCCRQQSIVCWDFRRQVGAKSPKLCCTYVCIFRTGKQVNERDSCHHRTSPATTHTHTQRMWTLHLPHIYWMTTLQEADNVSLYSEYFPRGHCGFMQDMEESPPYMKRTFQSL